MFRLLLILFMVYPKVQTSETDEITGTKINLTVYQTETLESVVLRLEQVTGNRIGYTTQMLLPYKAKAAVYQNISVAEILKEQLDGTPLKYKIEKKRLVLYKE